MSETSPPPARFAGLVELASDAVGGRAVLASDDFFAGKENLVRAAEPVFDPDAYTDRGKLMDGWESRRRRTPGHDWCIVELGLPGVVRGVDIDTRFFLGNHPPFAALDGCWAPGASPETLRDAVDWVPLLDEVPLQRGAHNVFAVADARAWTHLRLHQLPDGGVARLRVYGEPSGRPPAGEETDLALLAHGGRAVACSDMFFSPMHNLLRTAPSTYMGGGWETRRSRPPGADWVIVALGAPGRLRSIGVETHHFKGNAPDRCAVDGIYWPGAPPSMLIGHPDWVSIVPESRLRPHADHHLPVHDAGPWTHVRLRILPDGGVSRLRVRGVVDDTPPGARDPLLMHLTGLADAALEAALHRCCGATRWVRAMAEARPFASRAQLFGEGARIWWRLDVADWREAFGHHPRIGADVEKLRARFAATADWSAAEQAHVATASEHTLAALAEGNRAYEKRFGFIFIVCASGLSADEMLARLTDRMGNAPADELRIAAGEQMKITRLRLEKLWDAIDAIDEPSHDSADGSGDDSKDTPGGKA